MKSKIKNKITYSKIEKLLLVFLSLCVFTIPFESSMLNLVLPIIQKSFEINIQELGFISLSYLLTTSILLIPCSHISYIFGKKNIFIFGIFCIFLSDVLVLISYSFYFFLFCRIISGIGSACVMATSIAIFNSLFHDEKKGRALGINTASVYSGIALGFIVGALFTTTFYWKYMFLLTIPAFFISGVSLFKLLPNDSTNNSTNINTYDVDKIDIKGIILYSTSLLSILYSISSLNNKYSIYILIFGTLVFLLFLAHQKTQKFKLFNFKLFFQNKIFLKSNITVLLNYSATYAISFFLSIYLQSIGNLSPYITGLILLAQPVIQSLTSPIVGIYLSKKNSCIFTTLGLLVITLGLFFLSTIQLTTSVYLIVFYQFILGLGYSLFTTPNTYTIITSIDQKEVEFASGALATMRQIGMVLSMGLSISFISFTPYILKVFHLELYDNLLISMKSTFLFCSLLCGLGVLLSYTNIIYRLKNPL